MDELVWIMGSNGLPTMAEFIEVQEEAMSQPYPKTVWRIGSNGLPYNELLLDTDLVGAFANATDLQEVSIPKSVKKIGRYSFRNTKLKSVTISQDCEYFDTSFPDGCIVNFY